MEQSNLVERWSRWEPIEGLDPKYYVIELIDGYDGVKIRLMSDRDQSLGVELLFEAAWAYRVSEEGLRLDLMEQLSLKYGDVFYTKWTFFKVQDSSYLDWLSKESYDTSYGYQMTHYCLMSMESVVDIGAGVEPIVKLIKL